MIIPPPPPTARGTVRWSRVRSLGRSRLVRSSFIWIAVVPGAAKVALALKQNVAEPAWAKSMVDSLHLPFSWHLLFWSAMFMAIATALFDIYCPNIIRKHEHFGSFESAGEHSSHLMEYAEQVANRRDPCGDFTVYDMTVTHNASRTIFRHGVGTNIANELKPADVFWRLHFVAETHGALALRTTFVFYILGTALFLCVAIQNAWWVARALLEV